MHRSAAATLFIALSASCFYVTEEERRARFDLDGDGAERPFDCDDDDADVRQTETHFTDGDGDGFGDPDRPVPACGEVAGAVPNNDDCDDADEGAHPGATEVCDHVDNNCDQRVDEDQPPQRWFPDEDDDGFGDDDLAVEDCRPPDGAYVNVGGDCDDQDARVNPDADELCAAGDEDCDGAEQADDASLVRPTWYDDADQDGFGRPRTGVEDCVAPAGSVDNDLDCDDGATAVNPDADERCNGFDDNCDAVIDTDAEDRQLFFGDFDEDGYGDVNDTVEACVLPDGYTTNAADCDDADEAINPGVPDCVSTPGVNDDCDATTDEDGC